MYNLGGERRIDDLGEREQTRYGFIESSRCKEKILLEMQVNGPIKSDLSLIEVRRVVQRSASEIFVEVSTSFRKRKDSRD